MSGGRSSKDKKLCSSWRRNEAASGGEAVVEPERKDCLTLRVI